MPEYLRILDTDKMFRESRVTPIIINDLHNLTMNDREYFNNLIRETYTTDMVSVLPRCSCPDDRGLKGEHLIGTVCDICNTPVRQAIEADIKPTLWFRKPIGIKKLVNPIVWLMISDRFSRSKFRILQWLTDKNYGNSGSIKTPAIVQKMIAAGIPRGYNNFVENFDTVMDYLFSLTDFKPKKAYGAFADMLGFDKSHPDPLKNLLKDYRHLVFCDYLPLPNRAMLVLEKTALGLYGESTMFDINNTLNTMLSIDRDYYDKNQSTIENRTAKIMAMITDYYHNIFRSNLSPKEGLLRKHLGGARGNHGFRAVITSHEDVAHHDEIYIPWCVGVTVFRQHILNKLMNRNHRHGGLTHNQAVGLMMGHVYKYHPVLDAILKELIAEAPPRGIPCMIQRNEGV